jgi:Family of unknown function (DUF6101)
MAVGIAATKGRSSHGGWKGERRLPLPPQAPSKVISECERAEDGVQQIVVHADFIRIQRRIAGLETVVNVPTQSYRGITLRTSDREGDFEIALVHLDPSLELVLARTRDDSDIIALWRRFAATLDLPLLVEDRDGRLQAVENTTTCGPFERRNGSALKGRRPRFLNCRRVGNPGPHPAYHGEQILSQPAGA